MTSPVIDFESVMDAFAARFVAGTIGTPTGASAMRASYAETPKSVPALPAHLLEVIDGTVVANTRWEHHMNVDGVLLLAKRPGDPQRVETQRQLWLPYLLHATVDQMKLGLGGATGYEVKSVLPQGWEWDEFKVADVEFDAIRVHWDIWINETVALTP